MDRGTLVRSYNAAVEYLWIGGQRHGISSNTLKKANTDSVPNLSEDEIFCWKFNLLWSLKQYDVFSKTFCDTASALVAFKQLVPHFMTQILFEWISAFCKSPRIKSSIEEILPYILQHLWELSSLRLHILLNIICRLVLLSESKKNDREKWKLTFQESDGEKEQIASWTELVEGIEKELLERLVGFSFACSSLMSRSTSSLVSLPGSWYPFGLAQQIEQWVAIEPAKNQLKAFVVNAVQTGEGRLSTKMQGKSIAPIVGLPSPSRLLILAFCEGIGDNKSGSHKLVSCSRVDAGMQFQSIMVYFTCCNRWTSKLPPEPLFTMVRFPGVVNSSSLPIASKPLCPFCGVLQRLQPEFLLSPFTRFVL